MKNQKKNPKQQNRLLLFGVGIALTILALIWIMQGTPLQN